MWRDLTRVLRNGMAPYAEGAYADPPVEVQPWCGVADQGFAVQRLALGTQSGTHVDAPSHFSEGGATLDALEGGAFVGPFAYAGPEGLRFAGERILFVQASDGWEIDAHRMEALLALGCKVWVMAGALRLAGEGPLALHRRLAEAGVWLVEDLAVEARELRGPGEVIALPLRLEGTSGSPARVLVRA